MGALLWLGSAALAVLIARLLLNLRHEHVPGLRVVTVLDIVRLAHSAPSTLDFWNKARSKDFAPHGMVQLYVPLLGHVVWVTDPIEHQRAFLSSKMMDLVTAMDTVMGWSMPEGVIANTDFRFPYLQQLLSGRRQIMFSEMAGHFLHKETAALIAQGRFEIFGSLEDLVSRSMVNTFLGIEGERLKSFADDVRLSDPVWLVAEAWGVLGVLLPTWLYRHTPFMRQRVTEPHQRMRAIVDEVVRQARLDGRADDEQSFLGFSIQRLGDHPQELYNFIWSTLMAATTNTFITAAWALYEMAARPDVQATLRKEIERVEARDLRTEADRLNALVRMEAFVREIIRVYASATRFRKTLSDFPIAGISIPKGTVVVSSVAQAHLFTEELFEHGTEFIPERQLVRETRADGDEGLAVDYSQVRDCTNTIFGAGAHPCLGAKLAMLNIKTILKQFLIEAEIVDVEPRGFNVRNQRLSGGLRPQTPFYVTVRPLKQDQNCS